MNSRRLAVALIALSSMMFLCAEAVAAEPFGAAVPAVSTPEPFSMSGSFLRMIGGLLLCLGAFAGGVRAYRKYLGQSPAGMRRRLAVLERVSVSQKGSVALITLDGKEFLVTCGTDSPRIHPTSATRGSYFDESLDEACGDQEPFNA